MVLIIHGGYAPVIAIVGKAFNRRMLRFDALGCIDNIAKVGVRTDLKAVIGGARNGLPDKIIIGKGGPFGALWRGDQLHNQIAISAPILRKGANF